MRLLVTGGAGFIGSHFVEKSLLEGHEIAILDNFNNFYPPAIKEENCRAFKADVKIDRVDLRDRNAVLRSVKEFRPQGIVHLAARAGVRPSIEEPELYIDTNIKGTFHLLEAARASGVERFVFASSSSVYGTLKTVPFHEELCLNKTISPYAATKLAGEQLCSNYAHLFGIRCVSLRFFTVYGPRQRPDLAIHAFTRAIQAGHPIRQFGDGSTRRDYTYIDDIIQGMLSSISFQGEPCEVFNLGESETTSLADLIASLERLLHRKAIIQVHPQQPGDVPLTYADISKARKLLGYAPKTQISEGLPKFVDWFLQQER